MRLTLTKRGGQGIRLLAHLASLEPGTTLTSAELGATCDIPAGNVPTIVNRLSRAGILTCTPGAGGGCSLARHPSAISTLEMIEALDGPLEASVCLLDGARCTDRDAHCVMHPTWIATRGSIIDELTSTSLADVVESGGSIAAAG